MSNPTANKSENTSATSLDYDSDRRILRLKTADVMAGASALDPSDIAYLRDFFRWIPTMGWPSSPGIYWGEIAYLAALAGASGQKSKANDHLRFLQSMESSTELFNIGSRYVDGRYYFGFLFKEYVDAIRAQLLTIINSGKIPPLMNRPQWSINAPVGVFQRPISKQNLKLIEKFAGDLTQTPVEDYKATRAPELREVSEKINSGEIDTNDLDEWVLRAESAKIERIKAWEASEARINQIESDMVAALEDLAAAHRDPVAGSAESMQLDGILSSLKKSIKKTWKERVVDNLRRVRDDMARDLLPSGVRELGRNLEREAGRFGRRVDAEFKRTAANITTYAPWIRALSPLLYLTPLGTLGVIATLTGLAAVETFHSYRVKRESAKKLDDFERWASAEISKINAEADRIRAEKIRLSGLFTQAESEYRELADLTMDSTIWTVEEDRRESMINSVIAGIGSFCAVTAARKQSKMAGLAAAASLVLLIARRK